MQHRRQGVAHGLAEHGGPPGGSRSPGDSWGGRRTRTRRQYVGLAGERAPGPTDERRRPPVRCVRRAIRRPSGPGRGAAGVAGAAASGRAAARRDRLCRGTVALPLPGAADRVRLARPHCSCPVRRRIRAPARTIRDRRRGRRNVDGSAHVVVRAVVRRVPSGLPAGGGPRAGGLRRRRAPQPGRRAVAGHGRPVEHGHPGRRDEDGGAVQGRRAGRRCRGGGGRPGAPGLGRDAARRAQGQGGRRRRRDDRRPRRPRPAAGLGDRQAVAAGLRRRRPRRWTACAGTWTRSRGCSPPTSTAAVRAHAAVRAGQQHRQLELPDERAGARRAGAAARRATRWSRRRRRRAARSA